MQLTHHSITPRSSNVYDHLKLLSATADSVLHLITLGARKNIFSARDRSAHISADEIRVAFMII